jgi:hypothetical protein
MKQSNSADLLGIDTSEPISQQQNTASSQVLYLEFTVLNHIIFEMTYQSNSSIDLFGLDTLAPMQPTTAVPPMTAKPAMGQAPMQSASPASYMGMASNPMSRGIDPFSTLDSSGKSTGGYDRRGSGIGQQPPRNLPPPQGRRY